MDYYQTKSLEALLINLILDFVMVGTCKSEEEKEGGREGGREEGKEGGMEGVKERWPVKEKVEAVRNPAKEIKISRTKIKVSKCERRK